MTVPKLEHSTPATEVLDIDLKPQSDTCKVEKPTSACPIRIVEDEASGQQIAVVFEWENGEEGIMYLDHLARLALGL